MNLAVQRRPRSHAERSAATRQAVLQAALRVLHVSGYTGATIAAIRDEAGVSTGALNHQFPSKAKLMAAIVERFSDERMAAYNNALSTAATPKTIVEAFLDATEAVIRLPEMSAVNEIHLARRNDRELDDLTKPIYDSFNQYVGQWLQSARQAAGFENAQRFDDFIMLSFAVYRGIGMDVVDNISEQRVQGALSLWREFTMQFYFRAETLQAPG